MQKPVNRCLNDEMMDRIDHALGRPLDPTKETYRNFYATDGALADIMAVSPFWKEGKSGTLRYFYVTEAGCRALAEHLRAIGDQHKAFIVQFDGFTQTVVATSRAKARYSYFLDVSDSWSDLEFKDYCRRVSVRAA